MNRNSLNIASDNKTVVNYSNGFNSDIITTIHKNVAPAAKQMREVAKTFKGATEYQTAKNIYNFLIKEIKYVKDPEGYQNIKLPGRFVAEGTGDCKSYSLFTAAILENLNIPYSFRYASYSAIPTPQHVYIVLDSGIIIDAVYRKFNAEKPFTFKKDYNMKIQTLSGIGCNSCNGISNEVLITGLKKAVKNVTKKVQTAAKNTGVVKAASKLQTKAKNTGVVKAASKLQNKVKQLTPKAVALAAPRRAFRTLVAINFSGFANRLNNNINKAFEIWLKMGGNTSELKQSIDAGIKRKPLFAKKTDKISGINGIGEPAAATVAATLAIATPIIVAMGALIKNTADAFKSNKPNNSQDSNTNTTQSNGGGYNESGQQEGQSSNSGGYMPADSTGTTEATNYMKPLLIGAAILFGAKALKII